MITRSLEREDKHVYGFFKDYYGGNEITSEVIERFSRFGTPTSKGYQRLTDVDDAALLKNTTGYKIFKK